MYTSTHVPHTHTHAHTHTHTHTCTHTHAHTHTQGGKMVVIAGQIGLLPATMTLTPPTHQPSLSLTHVTSVLEANHASLGSALCGVCYCTTEEAGWAARVTWRKVYTCTHAHTHTYTHTLTMTTPCSLQQRQDLGGRGPAVVFLRVPALPRGACVEWSFIALSSSCHLQCKILHLLYIQWCASPWPSACLLCV